MSFAMMLIFGDSWAQSPFIVPVAGCLMILGIVLGGVWSGIRRREIEGQERLAAIAKGIAPPLTPAELAIIHGRPDASLHRRRANSRRAGIVLVAAGAGLAAFFVVLTVIVQVREVLSGAAVSLIPLAIGVGFLIDTRLQTREMEEAQNNVTQLPQPVDLIP